MHSGAVGAQCFRAVGAQCVGPLVHNALHTVVHNGAEAAEGQKRSEKGVAVGGWFREVSRAVRQGGFESGLASRSEIECERDRERR